MICLYGRLTRQICTAAITRPLYANAFIPPNAIAYSTGLIKTKQMFTTGMIVGVISLIIGYILIIAVGRMGYFG